MNAAVSHPPFRGPNAIAALRASTWAGHRVWMLVVYAFLVVVACVLPQVARHPDKGLIGSAAMLGVGAAMLWSGWVSRLVLLRVQAARMRIPGVATTARHAIVLGIIVTVLLPGAILALAGVAPTLAFGLPALGAAGGLLCVLLPWPFLAMLIVAGSIANRPLKALVAQLETQTGIALLSHSALLPWLAVATLLAIWRWRAVGRMRDAEDMPGWRRPLVLFRPNNFTQFGLPPADTDANTWQARAGWLAPVTRADNAGPHDPTTAIGACLGGTMGQIAPRKAVIQWAAIVAVVALLLVVPVDDALALIRDALLVGGVVGLLAGGWTLALRLHRQRQRLSGEFGELALLPGLGTPDAARTALLRGVMRRLAGLMAFALAGQLLVLLVRGADLSHYALIVGLWLGVCAASTLLCMVTLAGQAPATFRMFLAMLPLLLLGSFTLGASYLRIPAAGFGAGVITAWIILSLAYLGAALGFLQRFRARPHAFLLP